MFAKKRDVLYAWWMGKVLGMIHGEFVGEKVDGMPLNPNLSGG
jgi:hypothetical protein